MTITLEDSDGRVLATITPGEGQCVRLTYADTPQKRWFDSYHSTVIGPIHKKPQAKTQMSFGRNLPERIS